jgi:hypothetical protein
MSAPNCTYHCFAITRDGNRVLDFYGEVNATFGSKVSISGDGNTFLVSSVQSKSEYVLVYKFDSSINNYTQIGSFLVGNASDVYDAPLSISGDGSTFVVGAPKSDFGNRDSVFSAGYVRVYKLDSSINSYAQFGLDIMAQEGDGGFGVSVSISDDGTTFVVSAATKGPYVVYEPFYTIVERIARGLTRVYKLDSTLNAYAQVGSDIFAFNIFSVTGNGVIGSSVSISADGTTFVVGTYNQFGAGRGLVDIYKLNSSLSTYSKVGSTIDEFDFSSVSMSADGLTFVVGSTSYMCINPSRFYCGKVRVYKLDALEIAYKQYGDTIYGEPDDFLGYSVSISADGTTFAAGTNALTGYVRVYTVSSLENYTQLNTSTAGNGFGKVVSMSSKGVPFVVSSLSNVGGVDSVRVYLNITDPFRNESNCCPFCFLCKKTDGKCGLFCRLFSLLFKNL